ncbi:MAG: insulinase family protein, partial [Rickettsiales bacterium]|nr:insulinase family protein [Rickettsiales bacterium]
MLASLLACAPCVGLAAESVAEHFTLENGLEVIVLPNHRVPAVSHMLWYKIGAADDPQGKSGLAHFHEHMMYQGTNTLKKGEYSRIIAEKGGQENAFTGYDATSYYVNIRKEELGLAMKLEADRMRALKPASEDALKEKEVIIEERRSRIENSPDALLSEQVNAALFRNHPYHVPVIGWMHEMEGLSLQDVQDFHAKYYHPNNAILIVSGDVTGDEVKKLALEHYGKLPPKPIPARVWKQEPPQNAKRRVSLSHVNVQQESWMRDYAAPSVAYGAKDQALPLFLLSQLLGGGKTSKLYA